MVAVVMIAENVRAVRRRVEGAAGVVGRDPVEVRVLLAVKAQTGPAVLEALGAGADLLGHNRAQELTAMAPALAAPGVPPHEMHFIGRLQGNKVGQVLPWVTCVQSVDSVRLAERMDRAVARRGQAPCAPPVLDVLVQVNVSGEPTKAGVGPAEAADLAAAVGSLRHLRLCGFMTVGANAPDAGAVRASYERLAQVRADVLRGGEAGTAGATELSMGMSGDLELAVAAGATIVRVGTAVFGPRPAGPQGTR